MKAIKMTPGLGNQMFQYAFILNYILLGEEVKVDVLDISKNSLHNGFEINKIFRGLNLSLLSKRDRFYMIGPVFYYRGVDLNLYKIIRKIIKKISFGEYVYTFDRYIQEDEMISDFNFNENYLKSKKDVDTYFSGFFCSYKYFEKIDNKLRKAFMFPDITEEDQQNFKTLQNIRESESISIHVRRGDYLKYNFFSVCDIDYFESAFNLIISKLESQNRAKNIKLFIFSDDINWCKQNMKFLSKFETNYIDWNKKENSYKDMQLMSECKHNIIPNSTFSWWAAYLNQNEEKIVIVPKYWFKGVLNTKDRCSEDWIRV